MIEQRKLKEIDHSEEIQGKEYGTDRMEMHVDDEMIKEMR